MARWPEDNFQSMIRIMQKATLGGILFILTIVLEKEMILKEKHTKAAKKMIVKAHKNTNAWILNFALVSFDLCVFHEIWWALG